MALLHLEGVWQNRLAVFQANKNINIRNKLRVNQVSSLYILSRRGLSELEIWELCLVM